MSVDSGISANPNSRSTQSYDSRHFPAYTSEIHEWDGREQGHIVRTLGVTAFQRRSGTFAGWAWRFEDGKTPSTKRKPCDPRIISRHLLSESGLWKGEQVAPSGCGTFQSSGRPLTLVPMSTRMFSQPKTTLQRKAIVLTEISERSVLFKAETKSYSDPDRMIDHEVTIPVTPAAAYGVLPIGTLSKD